MADEEPKRPAGQSKPRFATGTQSRQGVISGRVVTVLIVSLVLVIIGLAATSLIGH